MKKTQKKVLGLLGFSVVAVMTVTAALLPSPSTSAIASFTNTLELRVVGEVPKMSITGISSGETYVDPRIGFKVGYENVSEFTVTLTYKDEDGNVVTRSLGENEVDFQAGSEEYLLDTSEFGYGEYTITVRGVGGDGVYSEDTITFSHVPVVGKVAEDEDTGKQTLELNYYKDGEILDEEDRVSEILVNVYDKDGNLVESVSPIKVTPPKTSVELNFEDKKLPAGTYTLEVAAYNSDGELLYKPYTVQYKYEPVAVPDTGGLFKNLNISKEDYLITGVLTFFVFGIVGLGIIMRKDKKSSAKSHK